MQHHNIHHAVSAPPQMPHILCDEQGFLLDSVPWTREVSKTLAALHRVGSLTEQHWKVIDFLRAYHAEFGAIPIMRRVCRESGVGRRTVKGLFGTCRDAWRTAGLPHPGEEALTYMD